MISGNSDATAGAWTAVAQPCITSSARYSEIGTGSSARIASGENSALTSASPSPTSPVVPAAIVASARRSERSTSVPAGTNSATTGTTCAAPTAARISLLLVRS